MEPELLAIVNNWEYELKCFLSDAAKSRIGSFLRRMGTANPTISLFQTNAGPKKVIHPAGSPDTGFVITQYPDGTLYVGGVRGGLREGRGARTYPGKPLMYFGEYVQGRKQGRGQLLSLPGLEKLYDGMWSNDLKEGTGVLVYDKGTYEGNFHEDMFNGRGRLVWKNGDVYEGDFLNGQRTGRGVLRFANGDVYEGDFFDARFHGNGVYRWTTGESYTGAFQEGRVVGTGTVNYQVNVGPPIPGQVTNGIAQATPTGSFIAQPLPNPPLQR